tara:strand:- start:50 stop:181 length:132 start_codon:yes stop_codon:yes gene_type:complete
LATGEDFYSLQFEKFFELIMAKIGLPPSASVLSGAAVLDLGDS